MSQRWRGRERGEGRGGKRKRGRGGGEGKTRGGKKERGWREECLKKVSRKEGERKVEGRVDGWEVHARTHTHTHRTYFN